MEVFFISKQKGNTVVQCPELGPKATIRFVRGKYGTTNKVEIRTLLSGEFATRYTQLAPGQDLEKVSEYLDSDSRPDVFTKEYLDAIPFDLWENILQGTDAVDVPFPLVGVAKATLQGKPIDPVIEKIVEEYNAQNQEERKPLKVALPKAQKKAEEPSEDVSEVSDEPEDKQWSSSDFSVREGMSFLKGKEYEEVKYFISDDEDRVSLIRAWNTQFPDHAVELTK